MRVQMQGEAAEKFALENQKIASRLGRSFGEFLSLFIVFYAIGKKNMVGDQRKETRW